MRPSPGVPCEHCPVGPQCDAIRYNHGRYCEKVDPCHEDYDPEMADVLRAQSLGIRRVTPGLSREMKIIIAIGRCNVRQLDGCGCGGKAYCFRSGTPRPVVIADCRACPVADFPKE